ncbi:MAG: 23S rRNA (guanosine(2251)-2'-O)-methyltransferase RlmB [Flavobacteriales bacterium]
MEHNDFIYGTRAVIEAIAAGRELNKVMIQQGLKNELISELRHHLKNTEIPTQYVPAEKLNRLSKKNHQGVIAFASPIVYQEIETLLPFFFESGRVPSVVILDRVTDVRNFGSIARSAECFGVDAIIVPSRGSALANSDAVKTSAGALNKIPVCRSSNLKNTIDFLKDSGLRIVACTEKGSKNLHEVDYTIPTAFIMGSEEDGISPEYLKKADEQVFIPMSGTISSLNVSVSAAIAFYELQKQRI